MQLPLSASLQEKIGARPVRRTIYPTICFDRSATLEEVDDPQSTFLVGDSMIRQQVVEFCGRVPHRRQKYCYPRARTNDITVAFEKVSSEATKDSLFLLHTRTNDAPKRCSEELVDEYRKLIQQYKTNHQIL